MTFNEVKKFFEDNPDRRSRVYVLSTAIRVINSEPAIKSVEYVDGRREEFEAEEIPDVYPEDCMITIGNDDFLDNPNQFKAFDGFNILTLEVDDPDAEFAVDAVSYFMGDE